MTFYPWVATLVFWGPEAAGDVTHWLVLGGLWTFIAFHGALGLVGSMLQGTPFGMKFTTASLWLVAHRLPSAWWRSSSSKASTIGR